MNIFTQYKIHVKLKFLFAFLFSFLYITSAVCARHSEFEIVGKAERLNSSIIYLTYTLDAIRDIRDSCIINNGKFSFKGHIPHTVAVFLEVKNPLSGNTLESRFCMIEQGSQLVKVSANKNELTVRVKNENDRIVIAYRNKKNSYQSLLRNFSTDASAIKIADSIKKLDSIKISWLGIFSADIREAKDKVASAYMLHSAMYDLPDSVLVSLYNCLDQPVKETLYGKLVSYRVKSAIGAVAPDFAAVTETGKSIVLSDIVSSADYTLLVFWASWCKPCRREIPDLKNLISRSRDKALKLITISVDSDESKWRKAIHDDAIDAWINIRSSEKDFESFQRMYGVMPIPTHVLINSSGKIIYRGTGEPILKIQECLELR
jgi:peroxiredoxin